MSALSETINSGRKANSTGNQLERFVQMNLELQGYGLFEGDKRHLFDNRHLVEGKQFHAQVNVGQTIYQTRRNVDFLVLNSDQFPDGLIIECKWQQSSGSVDEKYPFLIFNILKTQVPTVVLLDGDGYKLGAKAWLESQVDPSKFLMAVWSMQQFQRKVNDGFLG